MNAQFNVYFNMNLHCLLLFVVMNAYGNCRGAGMETQALKSALKIRSVRKHQRVSAYQSLALLYRRL